MVFDALVVVSFVLASEASPRSWEDRSRVDDIAVTLDIPGWAMDFCEAFRLDEPGNNR